ncbi:hypothetical protein [Alkalibacter saccharofermentans]|uniref:N(6)-L-threonylcarbamoyladenine synthase n=1 Tax=Alkalibacter saccharofermentans DSM 14828 TaxID=1120975 RepID=A0A1M4UF77_9FIRM|nr:hypothetical protein [Alkalibacter saccharofermentans]SHE55451.1 N6-L-threonylcarbamoyladenine synthase [Alkalibacter saccharofermentans DSM 14828]
MKSNLFLGIDTSNYTTSLSVVDEMGTRVWDLRIPLRVGEGKRGLRQQEAVFQHIKNLGELAKTMDCLEGRVSVVAASSKPRMAEGSYMPVFEVSKNIGMLLASALGACFVETSHQRGHIRAALNLNDGISEGFIGVHISGGTTEFVEYKWNKSFIKEVIVDKTLDISLGQVIDRIGVEMGFPFPAGRWMEQFLDVENKRSFEKKISYKSNRNSRGINLSGLETYLYRLYKETDDKALVIRTAFENASRLLAEVGVDRCSEASVADLLVCGGVASNRYIRESVKKKLAESNVNGYFCAPGDCTDNAFGVALIGRDHFEERCK